MNEILNGRLSSVPARVKTGIITSAQAQFVEQLFNNMRIWIIVTSDDDKEAISRELSKQPLEYNTDIMSLEDVFAEIKSALPLSV